MEPNAKRRMPADYVPVPADMHRQPGPDAHRAMPPTMPVMPPGPVVHVNGHGAPPRHAPMPIPPGGEHQAPVEVHDGEMPRERTEEWNGLVSMMTVIHAMVEKVYQAMCMLRETEQQDRANWIAYSQRQREDGEHTAATQANRIISSAMGKAEEVIQRRPYSPPVDQPPPHMAPGHEQPAQARPIVHQQGAPVQPHVLVDPMARAPAGPSSQPPPPQVPPDQPVQAPATTTEDDEVCWNCGREATETCSRCKKARYCGVWCQRRDWKIKHHRSCREPGNDEPTEAQNGDKEANIPRTTSMQVDRAHPHQAEAEGHHDAQRGAAAAPDQQQQQQQQQQGVVYVQDTPST